ncbi:MAG TPA: RDD family protein [Vicinamibacteria bacterium]|nr:RDD family protein [Vicinamibacteria bacterium]
MTCPTCGGELVPGGSRCPVCDASVAPRVEGALATDPRLLTPPARGKSRVDPPRDIPGLRKREKTWRDEVQERVRSRRQKRVDAGLPLFDQPEAGPTPAAPPAPPETPALSAPPVPLAEVPAAPRPSPRPVALPPQGESRAEGFAIEPDLASTRLSEAELADLPLRAPAAGDMEGLDREVSDAVRAARRPVPSLDEDSFLGEADLDGEVELSAPVAEPTPVERPARAAERAQAAAVDALLFGALSALVVYFTGRAARADLGALVSSWPGLAAYLGLLALFYAGYFTGTTGQTPGKLLTGLRVVGATGRPPGYLRAMARAFVGLLGTALVGLGLLPMAFDPAGRTLHDRLFRTRVVRN